MWLIVLNLQKIIFLFFFCFTVRTNGFSSSRGRYTLCNARQKRALQSFMWDFYLFILCVCFSFSLSNRTVHLCCLLICAAPIYQSLMLFSAERERERWKTLSPLFFLQHLVHIMNYAKCKLRRFISSSCGSFLSNFLLSCAQCCIKYGTKVNTS